MSLLPPDRQQPSPQSAEITMLLELLRNGDRTAEQRLLEVLYNDLKKLAARFLVNEGQSQSLRLTAPPWGGIIGQLKMSLLAWLFCSFAAI